MNIEELFTLSGTGLVIGALLSWLSLAFTARRIPASAAQTQPNSRQPLSSGGKALRVFSLAAALLALIGLGWGLLDRWRWYMWQMNTDWFLSFPTATFYESAVFCAFLTALASAACSSVRRSPQLFGGGIMLSGIVLLAMRCRLLQCSFCPPFKAIGWLHMSRFPLQPTHSLAFLPAPEPHFSAAAPRRKQLHRSSAV